MDGTRPFRTFRRITLPLLWPNLLVVLILALIRAVQIFDEVFVLTGGGPGIEHAVPHAVHLPDRLRRPHPQSRPRRQRLDRHGRRAGRADVGAARRLRLARAAGARMSGVAAFLTRRRGGRSWHLTDVLARDLARHRALPDVRPGGLARRSPRSRRRPRWSSSRRRCCRSTRRTAIVRGLRQAAAALPRRRRGRQRARARAGPPHRHGRADGRSGGARARSSRCRSTSGAGARAALRHGELRGAAPAVRLPHLPEELGLRHRRRDDHHAHRQLDGGLRAVEIRVPRPHGRARASSSRR